MSGQKTGWWANLPAYIVSLLTAWYGEAGKREGDYGYHWLPKIIGDHSHLVTSYAMLDGKIKGYFLFGQNPAAGSTNARMQRRALEQLDWMVVRDLYMVESSVFWQKGPDGRGRLFAPGGLKDGPMPTHYEAAESPVHNQLYRQQSNPTAKFYRDRKDNPLARVGDPRYPIVITTYRLTEHHVSGPMTRWMPWLNALQPALFAELSPELAEEKGIQHGGWLVISTPRGEIQARALVTRRMQPLRIGGRTVHQIGLPFHWGFQKNDHIGSPSLQTTHP